MPPQFYILTSLAAILSGDVSTPEQRDAVTRLALGWFGRLMINPRALPEKDGQGLVILTYEGDEARGGQVGARHRVHVRSSKGVVSANRLTLELYNPDTNKYPDAGCCFRTEYRHLFRGAH